MSYPCPPFGGIMTSNDAVPPVFVYPSGTPLAPGIKFIIPVV